MTKTEHATRRAILRKLQHTPGPWQVNTTWAMIEGPKGQEIAACHAAQEPGEKRNDPATCAANARLIAAAPELFEALKAIVENWSESTDKQRAIAQRAIACSRVIQEAREVLAKVEGGK